MTQATGWTWQLRRGGLLVALLGLGLALALTATAADKAKQAPKAASATALAAPAGFTLAPVPAWVMPMTPDAAQTITAAPLQVLLIDRQTRLEKTGTWRYTHAVRKINETAGLQAGAQIELEFDPSYQKMIWHHLTLWREGKRIDKLDRKIIKLLHREPQLERQMVDGRMTASIVLDDLRVGDRVEWAVSLVGDNPVFGGKFADQEWSSSSMGPVGLVQLRLLAAPERVIHHREGPQSLGIEVSEQTLPGWHETLFRRRAVPQFRYDPVLPAAEYFVDMIELSEFGSWGEVAVWADQLFAKAASGLDALEPELNRIRTATTTAEQRLQAALDFVQRDIRYFGTEIGSSSHQPATADMVLRQRFGDCKDKSALLVNLLARLGLEAAPVLVSTYHRDTLKARLPSPLAFDHAIATVTLDGQTLWLDATRAQQRGTPSSRQSVGLGQGLIARADSTALTPLPLARDALRSETIDTFRFARLAEEGQFESITVYHGEMAEWLREGRAAMAADELQKQLIGEIMRAYPSFTPDGAAQFDEVDGRNAIRLTMRFRTGSNYWRLPDKRTLVGDFALLNLIVPLRLPDQTPRTQGLRINLPGRYLHKLRFEFGEEAFSQASNGQFDESNEHFTLALRYQGETRAQQIDGELRLLADSIAPGQWTRYRDQLNKIWPRLGTTSAVSTLSPAQITALRSETKALNERMQRGEIKVLTRNQVSARMNLSVAERMLAAERLPPKLRAQVLLERAVQLDHLGEASKALRSLQEAVALAPDLAEIHAALAVNALLRRADAEALTHADRALALASNNTGTRYTRAWANYFGGDLQRARDELREILQSSSEVERSYGGIWLYLATRRLGDDGLVATRGLMPTDSKPGWPFAVLQLMQGQLDLADALTVAGEDAEARRGRECELYFYAAQKALLDQDPVRARSYLRKSLETGVVEFNEYAMAQRELDRLGSK